MSKQESNNQNEAFKTANIGNPVQKKTDQQLKSEYFEFLSTNFIDCRKEKRFFDVKVKIAEKEFPAHRLVLAANSKYFMALFTNENSKEEIETCLSPDYVDEESFAKLLDAMYGETLEININDWVPLFTTCLFLQLSHFINLCEEYLLQNLEAIDLTKLIVLPELKMVESLYAVVKKHICRNFSKLYSRLAGISLNILEDLLSDPELFVTSTEQLYNFGRNWIAHDIKSRKQHLQLVASILKPFHSSSEESMKIVANMEDLFLSEYAVEIALQILLEPTRSSNKNDKDKLKLDISDSLFFLKPNDESEVLFGMFEKDSWVFLNEFQIPISSALLNTYDSAVASDTLYFAADRDILRDGVGSSSNCISFHGYRKETNEWIELMPPRSMPKCFVPCNSVLYLYENSHDDYQFSSYEPMLNRWLKVPAVNYPRYNAGIATDDKVLYMVGGTPLKTIGSTRPKNIIEYFDSRSGLWSRTILPSHKFKIGDVPYSGKTCFLKNTLFILETDCFVSIDIRCNKQILEIVDLEDFFDVNWLLMAKNNEELWIIDTKNGSNIEIFETNCEKKKSLSNPNVLVRPISMSL